MRVHPATDCLNITFSYTTILQPGLFLYSDTAARPLLEELTEYWSTALTTEKGSDREAIYSACSMVPNHTCLSPSSRAKGAGCLASLSSNLRLPPADLGVSAVPFLLRKPTQSVGCVIKRVLSVKANVQVKRRVNVQMVSTQVIVIVFSSLACHRAHQT